MKKLFILFLSAGFLASCVDDYTDANPPVQLDGPAPYISFVGTEIVESASGSTRDYTWVENNGTARVEVNIVDAPGLIDSVSVSLSNIQIPGLWGSVTFEGFEAVKGQSTGTFTVVYNAPNLDAESPFAVANEDIVITVYDAQDPRKRIDINTVPTFRTQFSRGSDCFSTINLVGFYRAVSSGFDAETSSNYTDLVDTVEVYLRTNGRESPGFYRLSDGSFGLYPAQGFTNNFVSFEVCGNEITDSEEEFAGLFTGSINEDGSWTASWSNTFGDTGETVLTPLEPVE